MASYRILKPTKHKTRADKAAACTCHVYTINGDASGFHLLLHPSPSQSKECSSTHFTGTAVRGRRASLSCLVTAAHVLPSPEDAERTLVSFDDYHECKEPLRAFLLEPDRLFVTNRSMDVTICAFEQRVVDVPSPPIYTRDDWVGPNVATISHPRGRAKTRSHGTVSMMTFNGRLFYTAQGDKGCSGGPIFDAKSWKVIGIETGENDVVLPRSVFTLSEGQRLEPILQELAVRGYVVD